MEKKPNVNYKISVMLTCSVPLTRLQVLDMFRQHRAYMGPKKMDIVGSWKKDRNGKVVVKYKIYRLYWYDDTIKIVREYF